MMDTIAQIMIFILGPGSVLICGLKNKNIAKWGFVVGLCSQPFWYYSTLAHEQYGVFAASIVYTIFWINGIRNNFWK